MNNKLIKTSTENNENLCPIRKRVPSKSSKHPSAWKLAKLEGSSSPTALTNEYLEEMGIGMLDSEESSSSTASAIALAVTASTDENSNEATPNLDAVKFCHQTRLHYRNMDNSILDATTDNASNHSLSDRNDKESKTNNNNNNNNNNTGQEQRLNVNNNSNSSSSFEIYGDDQQRQKMKNSDKFSVTSTQHKKLVSNVSGKSPTAGKRSPLATVTCNGFIINVHQQQQQIINQQQRSHSPSMLPSTSRQAALMKQHQQLEKQQPEQSEQPEQQLPMHQSAAFIPNKNFFLFRNREMNETNLSGKDNFNTLSDEIILQIFKWLPKKTLLRCGYVCQRFNRCASDESLWTRLDLGGRSLKPGALENILKRGIVILRLAQAEINHPVFEANFLDNESDFESKLQYLDLSMITITKSSLKMFLSRCRQLKKLSLEHVSLNDDICNEIAKNEDLEALNLAMCSGIEAWSVRKMMESLKQLSSLNISWTNLSIDAVTSLVTNITPNILRLNVAGCRKTMFDSHLESLHKRCPDLLELDLSDCTGLTGNAINIICKFKALEYLSLSRCYSIPAAAYIELRNMSTLIYLDIFGMLTESTLAMLEQTFSKIGINKFIHSSVARPTVGTRRTSIWGLRTRDFHA
uniref:S-phase kinase-associated protein 2 n=1 Tax=Glossina brevipalpis TaxID=37001 RepID=A0A1A9WPH1_9MUSC